MKRIITSFVRNAIVGAVLVAVSYLPTIIFVQCCLSLSEWLLNLLMGTLAGALIGLVSTAVPVYHEAVAGALVGLLVGVTVFLPDSTRLWGPFLELYFARITITIAITIGGAIAGLIANTSTPEPNGKLSKIITIFAFSLAGSVAAGAIASFISISGKMIAPLVSEPMPYSTWQNLPQVLAGTMMWGVFLSAPGFIPGGVVGGLLGLLGNFIGRVGDAKIGIAIGVSFGVILYTFISLFILAVFSSI